MHTSVKSEDPDKILHNAAFHQGLHYLLIQNDLHRKFKKEIQFYLLNLQIKLCFFLRKKYKLYFFLKRNTILFVNYNL